MPELQVSKKTIGKLLGEMQGRQFIIPDYQRPYKWDIEKCETLWKDIEDFYRTDSKSGADYFLGTIVTYNGENKSLEVIDGQQRLTSFFLLLRAFYHKLESMDGNDAGVSGLKNQLAPCIWDVDTLSNQVEDYNRIHIESQVATSEDNEIFHEILKAGTAPANATGNYAANYRYFLEKCDDYARDNPMDWKYLCIAVLKQCIVLPIECDNQETALTIFSTLNDRGMPLTDSDIFKAQLYKHKPLEERKAFTDEWKELTSICKAANSLSIDDVFRYYTHVLRARNKDKSKEVGLRSFYYGPDKSYKRLKEAGLMEDLMELATFWKYYQTRSKIECKIGGNDLEMPVATIGEESWKYLHCLHNYPNDYWKYVTSVYYLKNKDASDFEVGFTNFLRQLTAYMFARFVENPSVNGIKDPIYNACIEVQHNNRLGLNHTLSTDFVQRMEGHSSAKISRGLLLLDAYQNNGQVALVDWNFEVEHIFPKKWQTTNYNGWEEADAQQYLDRFGNKTVIEKKINIQAGNGYFGKKKARYEGSSIAHVLDLSIYKNDDWLKQDIEDRETRFVTTITSFLNKELSTT